MMTLIRRIVMILLLAFIISMMLFNDVGSGDTRFVPIQQVPETV